MNARSPCSHWLVRPFRSPSVTSVAVVPRRWKELNGCTIGSTTNRDAARSTTTATRVWIFSFVNVARPYRRPMAAPTDAVLVPESATPMNATGR